MTDPFCWFEITSASGSSREHAVWALRDFGIKAVLAPSFADIFYTNCFKNGVLPIILSQDFIEYLFKHAETTEIWVDLASAMHRI